MPKEVIVLGIICLGLIGIILFLLIKSREDKDSDGVKLLQEQIFNLNKTLDLKLSDANKMITDNMQKTFSTSTKINENANKKIEDITKKLTQLEETNKQIKDIGGQLKGLEDILKNPKQRGNLGEYFLKELLENVFNEKQYEIQHKIDGVGIVDAILLIGGKKIPIDSKFPQENYQKLVSCDGDEFSIKKYSKELKKDLKNRIDETSKYVNPEKGTTDFAFMLIPAEGMYYDIFINKLGELSLGKIIEYSFSKKVIICSPSSFYAYLQTVIQGLKSLQIEEQAKEIQKYVVKLQKDLSNYEELFKKVGKNLGTTVNSYNDAYKRYSIVDKDIIKITGTDEESNVEFTKINKPEV